jgi:outer membrane lipoprotein-sorting protein
MSFYFEVRKVLKFFYILILSIFCLNLESYGKTLSNKELAKVQSKMKAHKFLKLSFEQTRYKALRKKEVKSKGSAYFKLPTQFLWQLENSPQKWIYNGKKLIHWDSSKGSAVMYGSSAQKGKELRDIISLVTRFDSLNKDYAINESKISNNLLKLLLVPKKSSGDLQSVNVEFDLKKSHISALKLNFGGGNFSKFRFYSPKTSKFSENKFRLPKGTKIQTVN